MSSRSLRGNFSLWILIVLCLGAFGEVGCGTAQQPPKPKVDWSSRLSKQFAILRSPGRPASRLMQSRMHDTAQPLLPAHRASTANGPVWMVISSSAEVCFFAGIPPESSCEPAWVALRRGMTLGVVQQPADASQRMFVLYGVVPDGQHNVRIGIGNRAAEKITVENGVFSVRAEEPVVKL